MPIACGEAGVYPGDSMVGDGEGVVCIPAQLADQVAAEAFEQTIYEDLVQEEVDGGHGLFGLYPMLDQAVKDRFAAWRKAKGR